jgi:DNA primase catalytic core
VDDDASQPDGDTPAHKLAALQERLLSIAGAIRAPGGWERSLRAVARLPAESFPNVLLIDDQQPGATLVRGYEEWRAAGRQVSRGEQGIEVFSASRTSPADSGRGSRKRREPDPPAPGWREARRVAYVWDLSQTHGPPMPREPARAGARGEGQAGIWDALCWLARREGLAVEHEHGAPADGVTFWSAHRIRVLPGMDPGPAAWALAHQLGHMLMHRPADPQPGATTSGDACTGTRKAEADAIAFITCARYGIPVAHQLASPGAWAGTDQRAQPAAVLLTVGERITGAATRITRHLDRSLSRAALVPGIQPPTRDRAPSRLPLQRPPARSSARPTSHLAAEPDVPASRLVAVLRDAHSFYSARLPGSWVPAYLLSRQIGPEIIRDWHVGYAPAEWSALTGHLRAAGHADEEIEAAGLARRSSRGTLIEHFRDRVMLPIRDQHGQTAGFTGRARPGADATVPKYLNSPETSLYKKGSLLFGLHEARSALTAGAIPVIVEGPFDAVAVTTAGAGRLAGIAPCGTALTADQATLLAATCDLARTGALVAFDDDPPGRKAATRAYPILRPHTARVQSARLSGRDPARILEEQGPRALRETLTVTAGPLLGVVVDAEVSRWEHRLGDVEGPLRAMRSAAAVLAVLLPPEAAEQVREATGGTTIATVDEEMRPVVSAEVPGIARSLPADTAYQVTRLADRLCFPASDVVIEVANAVTRHPVTPSSQSPGSQAADSFPSKPLENPGEEAVQSPRAPRPGRHRIAGVTRRSL